MIKLITKHLEFIFSGIPWVNFLFESYYKKLVYNEIKSADIKSADRVLCIGGGPMPCTAVMISKTTGCKVTVLDNDERAVKKAVRFISNMNMSQYVNAVTGQGNEYPLSGFTVIHIAKQINGRKSILKNICENSSVGVRVIIRKAKNEKAHSVFSINNYYSNISHFC